MRADINAEFSTVLAEHQEQQDTGHSLHGSPQLPETAACTPSRLVAPDNHLDTPRTGVASHCIQKTLFSPAVTSTPRSHESLTQDLSQISKDIRSVLQHVETVNNISCCDITNLESRVGALESTVNEIKSQQATMISNQQQIQQQLASLLTCLQSSNVSSQAPPPPLSASLPPPASGCPPASSHFEDFTDLRFWQLTPHQLLSLGLVTPDALQTLVADIQPIVGSPFDQPEPMAYSIPTDIVNDARRGAHKPANFARKLSQRIFTLGELFNRNCSGRSSSDSGVKKRLCLSKLRAIELAVQAVFPASPGQWAECKTDGIDAGIRYLFGIKKLKSAKMSWLKVWMQ